MRDDLELTAEQRFRLVLDLMDDGIEMMRQNLRRAFPLANEAEVNARLVEWLHTRSNGGLNACEPQS